MCWFNLGGSIVCSAVKAGALDGISCGTQAGIGDGACQHYCSGKTCLAATAPVGMACRPDAASGLCEGQCDGGGHCAAVAQPCAVGRDEQLCKVAFCDQRNAAKCNVLNMSKGTTCSDSDACSISTCNATPAIPRAAPALARSTTRTRAATATPVRSVIPARPAPARRVRASSLATTASCARPTRATRTRAAPTCRFPAATTTPARPILATRTRALASTARSTVTIRTRARSTTARRSVAAPTPR